MTDFDSSQPGVEYSRVMSFSVDYPSTMTARTRVVLQPHVMLRNGEHRATGPSGNMQFDILPADLAEDDPEKGTVARMIELRDVATGAPLGIRMSVRQLFVGVASLIREQELAAAAALAPPTP